MSKNITDLSTIVYTEVKLDMLRPGTPSQADYLTINVIIDEPSYVEIGNILSSFISYYYHLKILFKTPNEVFLHQYLRNKQYFILID